MDLQLVTGNRHFGHITSYQRPGFDAFSIVGIHEFLDRFEDVNRGQFYSIFYRIADFDNATFSASVRATFTSAPNTNGKLTFAGVVYTSVSTLDNAVPYQFLRGSSAQGAASNLALCINADPAESGNFFSAATTAHPMCSASWVDNGDGSASTIVRALAAGIAGQSLTAEDNMSFASLNTRQFSGGISIEEDLVTLQNVVYRVSDVPELDPEGSIQLRLEKKAL